MRRSFLALALLAAACAAPDTDPAGSSGESAAAPVVVDLDASQLDVERLDIDLDVTIARFLAPPDQLPLDRVYLTADGQAAENLAGDIFSCFEPHDLELTNGGGFIVTQDDSGVSAGRASDCLPCGLAYICPGLHEELGPGEKSHDPVPTDVSAPDDDPCGTGDSTSDPADDTSGGSTGGTSGGSSSGSSGGSTSSGSGAGTGGGGGASGGAGNPGWD